MGRTNPDLANDRFKGLYPEWQFEGFMQASSNQRKWEGGTSGIFPDQSMSPEYCFDGITIKRLWGEGQQHK